MKPLRQPRSDEAPMRGRLDLRMPLELLDRLHEVADDLGIDVAIVARTALRRGVDAAEKQLHREIEEHQRGGS